MTRISVERTEAGEWLATLDMDLGKGQQLTFRTLIPLSPELTVPELQHSLIQHARDLLTQMADDNRTAKP